MPESILIFKSQTTNAIYYWHVGSIPKVTVMKEGKRRAIGTSHYGIPVDVLSGAYHLKADQFSVGDANYIVLARL